MVILYRNKQRIPDEVLSVDHITDASCILAIHDALLNNDLDHAKELTLLAMDVLEKKVKLLEAQDLDFNIAERAEIKRIRVILNEALLKKDSTQDNSPQRKLVPKREL